MAHQRLSESFTDARISHPVEIYSIGEVPTLGSARRHAGVFAPTADIGRILGAVRATACLGVIVPGPKAPLEGDGFELLVPPR